MISRISEDAYQAARRHAAFIERLDRGRIVVSGRDRATYLQGLLTNDITALKPGEGCYTAYLTPQGRMIADLFVYELGDLMLLTMPLELKDVVLAKLDQFIFTEDVQLGDVTATFAETSIVGPDAARVLAGVLDEGSRDALAALPEPGLVLEGESVPTRGAAVRADGRDVGHVTSSVLSPALKRPIALAYVHRDFVAPGTAVSVEGARAVVAEVPFVRGQSL